MTMRANRANNGLHAAPPGGGRDDVSERKTDASDTDAGEAPWRQHVAEVTRRCRVLLGIEAVLGETFQRFRGYRGWTDTGVDLAARADRDRERLASSISIAGERGTDRAGERLASVRPAPEGEFVVAATLSEIDRIDRVSYRRLDLAEIDETVNECPGVGNSRERGQTSTHRANERSNFDVRCPRSVHDHVRTQVAQERASTPAQKRRALARGRRPRQDSLRAE